MCTHMNEKFIKIFLPLGVDFCYDTATKLCTLISCFFFFLFSKQEYFNRETPLTYYLHYLF